YWNTALLTHQFPKATTYISQCAVCISPFPRTIRETPSYDRKRKKRVKDRILHPLELNAVVTLLAFAETPLIVDDCPGFFFVNRSRNQRHHSCACTPVLDYPEELAIFPLLVELAVCEIAGSRIQNLTSLAHAIAVLAMAIEAGALSLEQRLSF